VPDAKVVADTVAKLTYLVGAGVKVGQDYARNELGVPKPAEDEDLLKAIVPPSPFGGGDPGQQDGKPGAFGKKQPPAGKAKDGEDPADEAVANVARGITPALARHDAQMAGRLALFRANALDLLHRGQRAALQPLIDQIANIAGMEDQTQFEAALTKLKAELPRWYRRLAADPALANALEQIYGSCLVSKAAEAAAARTGAVAVKEAATA
jgi:phage gp29-like protein